MFLAIVTTCVLGAAFWVLFSYFGFKAKPTVTPAPKEGAGEGRPPVPPGVPIAAPPTAAVEPLRVTILYGTTSGTAKGFAERLVKELFAMTVSGFLFNVTVMDVKDYDQDNLEYEENVIYVMSTFTDGVPPVTAAGFCTWLADAALDFRVSKAFLGRVHHAVFALGDSNYGDAYCRAGKHLDSHMCALGSTPLTPCGVGDESAGFEEAWDTWRLNVLPALCERFSTLRGGDGEPASGAGCGTSSCTTETRTSSMKQQRSWEEAEPKVAAVSHEEAKRIKKERRERNRQARNANRAAAAGATMSQRAPTPAASVATTDELTEEDLINDAMLTLDQMEDEAETKDADGLMDLEDVASYYKRAMESKAAEEPEAGVIDFTRLTREMVTPKQRKALTKEGYKIIGTHSAVKLCRWTKHQLRGRGGCYKHTFYNITSYQCMEATPSLACANKCVFCWRHHKNPVGKEWRWRMDEPDLIVNTAVEQHRAMINQMKGVPGVKMDRWNAAFNVRHCALSLVGEPIMYPKISELIRLLHERNISSFLVTNAQFPAAISSLGPVTQLYVSIDAATRDTLKAVDRPLFKDFWERFLTSLRALRDKRQRTVYRLTLVKAYNMTEVDQYKRLIDVGHPDLIEIKAVTYCGKSDASPLTIKNSPWHTEVVAFAQAIADSTHGAYEIAAVHAHSCCVLLARTEFKIDGVWHTWIDYDRFFELVNRYYATDGAETFTAMDYIAPTAPWALYGAPEEGFDPVETRFRRNAAGVKVEDAYEASESGCG